MRSSTVCENFIKREDSPGAVQYIIALGETANIILRYYESFIIANAPFQLLN